MTKGLKVWLWIMLVLHANFTIMRFALEQLSLVLIVREIVIIGGIVLLLFKQKKIGFYILTSVCLIELAANIVLGNNIILSLISAVIPPAIIFLLMKKNWNKFL